MSSNVWQLDKSISETNLYMLEHQLLCDISFRVGGQFKKENSSQETLPQDFKAHRFMLVARSPVFSAMILSDNMDALQQVISIPDVTPEAFKNTLHFMYTDQCTLSEDNVLATLYCSRKYMVTGLTECCVAYLEENLTEENACLIYDQCLLYGFELAAKCRRLLERRTAQVLSAPSFISLPESAVESLLRLERVAVSEWSLFRAVHRWAEERCKESRGGREKEGGGGEGGGGGKGVKEAMAGILPLIRFPCMSVQEFLEVSKMCLLDPAERCSIFEFLLSDEDKRAAGTIHYPLTPRLNPSVFTLKRFSCFGKSNIYSGDCSVMKMSCSKNILLTGFGISASCDFDPVQDVHLAIKQGGRFLFNKSIVVNDDMTSSVLYLQLDPHVHLKAQQNYSVILTFHFSDGHDQGILKRGKGGSKTMTIEDHCFEFDRSDSGSLISEVKFQPALVD